MRRYKRGNCWYIDYIFQGKRIRQRVSRSEKITDLVMKDIEVKIAKEEYLGIKPQEKVLFKDFIKKYLEYSKANKTFLYYKSEKRCLEKRVMPLWEDKCLDEITPQDIEGYKARRIMEVKPASVNRELASLKHCYNIAIDWGLTEQNPVKKVKLFKEPPGRIRYLSNEEMVRLLDNCYEHLKPIVIIALNTGLRKGEILNLKWCDVDLKNRHITVQQSKNNEKRMVPMNKIVYQALREIDKTNDYLFAIADCKKSFATALKKSQIEDFRFHDLRHTFASYLAMSGCNLKTIQELMGHKDIKMTMRYSHLSKAYLEGAVEKLYTPI